jgi:hypothetical protein
VELAGPVVSTFPVGEATTNALQWRESVAWFACYYAVKVLCHSEQEARDLAGRDGWVEKMTSRVLVERLPHQAGAA